MDKDRVVGSAKQIKGAVKQAVGRAIGDAKLELDGRADKVEGKIQNAIGGTQRHAQRNIDIAACLSPQRRLSWTAFSTLSASLWSS